MNNLKNILLVLLLVIGLSEGSANCDVYKLETMNKTDTITLGAGCFWCVESIFQSLIGVEKVASGYSGGEIPNPTYKQICNEDTGHAEVCQIIYNPEQIKFSELLEVFWKIHDPTTLNRQGADVGTQYRSVIFYHNEYQRNEAERYKNKLNESGIWQDPIVTEVSPFKIFYKAEDYHQDYYDQNKNEQYCRLVITPKIEKFKKVFGDKLK